MAALQLLLIGGFSSLVAQDDEEDEDQPYRPGLIAVFEGAGGERAERVEEGVLLRGGAAPDGRLSPGPFSARWHGELIVPGSGEYRFYLHGEGEAELKLGDRVIAAGKLANGWLASEPQSLPPENLPIEVTYRAKERAGNIALYWSGPGFIREPISARYFQHDRSQSPSGRFERGEALATALRCAACHVETGGTDITRAPALDRLAGNVNREWLVDWLASSSPAQNRDDAEQRESGVGQIARRMPHFGLSRDDAAAIAAWLTSAEFKAGDAKTAAPSKPTSEAKPAAKSGKAPPKPSAATGKRLAVTLGCLACHQLDDLGQSGLFGGGDLSQIAAKRPAGFFERWLSDSAALNADHRMPVFELSDLERQSLALYLRELGQPKESTTDISTDAATLKRGKQLVADFGCVACHRLPGDPKSSEVKPTVAMARELSAASRWGQSCTKSAKSERNQPAYALTEDDAAAIEHYYTVRKSHSPPLVGRSLLVEQNCLACHTRDGFQSLAGVLPPPLADKLNAVAEVHQDLATRVPALTPPSLSSVGDKLHEDALAGAIRRQGPAHRTYLQVRMPKFRLSDEQLKSIVDYVVSTDRISAYEPGPSEPIIAAPTTEQLPRLHAAGSRLVTTDGFGCTSCHTVGGIDPPGAPANARGPELVGMHKRIRREWYERWVRNPARIVPRMEMPSVQLAVRGVLDDKIDDQLSAVWHVLATPGFKPPEPNPVRVLRLSGDPSKKERPITLNDVVKSGDKTWLFPLVVGLPNRHNVMFDLEHNRLAGWWIGDMARQRTKGKTWYWEQGGPTVFDPQIEGSELSLIVDGKELFPERRQQFLADMLGYSSATRQSGGVELETEVVFRTGGSIDGEQCTYVQTFHLPADGGEPVRSWGRTATVTSRAKSRVKLRLVGEALAKQSRWDASQAVLHLPGGIKIRVRTPQVDWHEDGCISAVVEAKPGENPGMVTFDLTYSSELPADQYLIESPPLLPVEAADIEIAPGFAGKRLPLPAEITPTGLAWGENGELVFSTLKGEVLAAKDSDGDGLADSLRTLADGLATPYGLQTGTDEKSEYVDVIAKNGLLRLPLEKNGGMVERVDVVAAGWGFTDDYHDWAVGLPRDRDGNYYLGIPCQQDNRSALAAKHRGEVLKLVPNASSNHWRKFQLETVTRGHRFPMGLALRRDGELFVTDNQGNYNPFNELNHVRAGDHFGFINAIEKKNPPPAGAGAKKPPLKEPAVNIPHPWTRSVNGICFLDTPEALRKDGKQLFGPFEGHLIGCEYDTRRLVRMSVEEVDGVFQGAAYPLSREPASGRLEDGLLGPIVCEVSPRGELFVGNIRDSGWGAGNNVGEIVRIEFDPEKLPGGIREVRSTPDGFLITFLRPVDVKRASDVANFSISSYRRESTPAYGGPDLDRRTEKIEGIDPSDDGMQVRVKLAKRAGFVYEFRLKNLSPAGREFYPAEAYYTVHRMK